jgi:hypothetical protein
VATYHFAIRSNHDVLRKVLLPVNKFIHGKNFQQHLFLHAGSDWHILKELDAFGIKLSGISSVLGGEIGTTTYIQKWINEQREHAKTWKL